MKRLVSYESNCKREMICRHEDCDTCEEYCPHMNEDNCPCLQEILDKLAGYEDLEERSIKETHFGLEMLIDKWCEFFEDIEELAEYQKLKEQGRLLELPCSLGDATFWISDEDECGNKVLTVKESNPVAGISAQMDGIYILTDGDDEYQKIGERWGFLTKEEAEKALENMKVAGIKNDKGENC